MGKSKKDWERIYSEKGDLQLKVLPKIKRVSRTFKERDYGKILDLGCGTGKHSIFLAQRGFSVYATDLSATGIAIAREKAKLRYLENIRFKQHDMRSIPFTDNYFDAVICTWTIYHGTLDEIQKTVDEIWRVLRPDGMVVTDFLSITDSTYGVGKEIEKDTFLGAKDEEEDVPHHYSTREELIRLFSRFQGIKIRATSAMGQNRLRKYYDVRAVK